jgi:hypothetical protein
MRRKPTRNTRGPNAYEKRFQGWLKEHACVWCNNPGPSIVDHCRGATFKHNKVLVGHWFCLPQCVTCDTQKTIHGKRLGNESKAWAFIANDYEVERMDATSIPDEVFLSIQDWNK